MDMFVIYNTNVDGRVGDSVHMAEGRTVHVKVGPPVHNYEHEAGSYGDGFT